MLSVCTGFGTGMVLIFRQQCIRVQGMSPISRSQPLLCTCNPCEVEPPSQWWAHRRREPRAVSESPSLQQTPCVVARTVPISFDLSMPDLAQQQWQSKLCAFRSSRCRGRCHLQVWLRLMQPPPPPPGNHIEALIEERLPIKLFWHFLSMTSCRSSKVQPRS